jgi:hypothetical protein
MTNTKTYENMTVTITCKENEDTEMLELLQRYQDAKTLHEATKEYYIPRTEAIGRAKWTMIVNQIFSLVKIAEEVNLFPRVNLYAHYYRDYGMDESITVSKQGGRYHITWRNGNYVCDSVVLDASPECCPDSLLKDKDGWLAKWDEYGIYSTLRDNLIYSIKSTTKRVIEEKNKIVETYKGFAGV